MNSNSYSVLVVDDEENILKLLQRELGSEERMVFTALTAKQARAKIKKSQVDVVVLDIRLPDGNGMDLFTEFKANDPDLEVVLITGHGDIASAVEAMRMGAYDYITKPFKLDRLEMVIDRAYQRVCLQRENRSFRHTQESASETQPLIGRSKAVSHIKFLIQKVAPTDVPVLITGESGAGKDVVAHSIQSQSMRASQPLIIKNCAMLQRELVRSELFGHKRGAFTGASEAKEGLIALAHKGTLFLDEIGDLPDEVQSSLLRVLEDKTYRRVGENEERRADIRFLFATNRNLVKAVEDGRFNEALFHRINVFNIHIPPLKDRKEDIPLLAEHILGRLRGPYERYSITDKCMQRLLRYNWPGNVRELRNVLERSMVLCEEGALTDQVLPRELLEEEHGADSVGSALTLDAMEREHIAHVLSFYNGNRQHAAEALGIGRKTLYRKMKKYNLE